MALDTLGIIDRFSNVFNLEDYYKHKFKYKCYLRLDYKSNAYIKDNVDFADTKGKPFPSYLVALLYVTAIRITHIPRKIQSLFKKK